VVGVDVLFFRHQFWERLIANVGIVFVFAALYLRFRRALGGKLKASAATTSSAP